MKQQIHELDGADVTAAARAQLIDELWRQCFGAKAREPDGHILRRSFGLRRLVRFIKNAEPVLGVPIPPTALLKLGTPLALRKAVDAGRWPEPSPLLLLRDGVPGPALFIVAAGSGLVLELCDLAQLIDFPGPIWGLQLPGLDGEAEPLARVEDIAAHHAAAILALHLAGPAHVVGYSFGGLVALELAERLRAAGHAVGLVGLIDSTCDERHWPRAAWLATSLRKARRRLAELRKLPPGIQCRHVVARGLALAAHVGRRVQRADRPSGPETSIYYIGGLEPDFQRVRNASISAWERYRPRPTAGRVVLFKSVLGDPHACDPVAIWRGLIPKLETVPIPGSHRTILRIPYVRALSEAIAGRLGPAGASEA